MDLLVQGMRQMSSEQARKYFRSIAVMLHPDKNGHPLANEAFVKIQKAFDQATAKTAASGYSFHMNNNSGFQPFDYSYNITNNLKNKK